MSDHNDNCAELDNSIDECDCNLGKLRRLEARVRELESLIPSNETISSMIQCANDRLRRGFRDDADGCDVIIYCNKVIEWRKKK